MLASNRSPRTKTFLFLQSARVAEQLSTPEMTAFLPYSPFVDKHCKSASNPMP